MYLDAGAVERHCLELDSDHLGALQLFEDSIQNARLGPSIHTSINGVPIAEPLRQPSPLAAMFGHEKNGVQDLQVGHADVATLGRQTAFDDRELS